MPVRKPSGVKVSVCIPTYKGAATIAESMRSVLAQTWGDLELLVVDDNSPDDTAAIVASFDDPRVTYLRNPINLGPKGNWNRCLAMARGDYIKLLPHDDVLYPECLDQQVSVLEDDSSEAIALVCCARDIIGPDGRVLMRHRGWPNPPVEAASRADALRACLRAGTNVLGEPGAVLFRRALAERVGGFDDAHPYVIDLDYWLRLLCHGQVRYIDRALACFRVWRGSWSVAIGRDQSRQFSDLMLDLRRSLPDRLGPLDRALAWVMPGVNRQARRLFYVLHLRQPR